jgi:hypothetical protein
MACRSKLNRKYLRRHPGRFVSTQVTQRSIACNKPAMLENEKRKPPRSVYLKFGTGGISNLFPRGTLEHTALPGAPDGTGHAGKLKIHKHRLAIR